MTTGFTASNSLVLVQGQRNSLFSTRAGISAKYFVSDAAKKLRNVECARRVVDPKVFRSAAHTYKDRVT